MSTAKSLAELTAERFLDALGCRDFARLEACLDDAIHFRALIPPGLREATDRRNTSAYFARWFGDADHFELSHSEVEPIADRLRISYRMRLHDGQGWHRAEQHLFCDIESDQITHLDLLCSGFRS